MRYLKASILAIFTLLSLNSNAEEVFGSFGIGVFNSAKSNPSEVRDIYVGWRKPIAQGTYFQVKGGMWADSAGQGRTNGGFIGVGPGMMVDLNPVLIRAGVNGTVITNPDAYLGGWFQMNEEVYLGLRDGIGNSIGIVYDHFSNAGIVQPNQGRDMISIQVGQSF